LIVDSLISFPSRAMKQSMLKIVVALVVLPLVRSLALDAVREARVFLRSHAVAAPKADELAELKNENPEAYALVKALLTKRSLGLLDPKNPTASFAKASPQQSSEDQGPEAFAKFASPGELRASRMAQQQAPVGKVDVPYAEVQSAPAHKDFFNWKGSSSADEETMVQNVLGAVAGLTGKKAGLLSKQHSSSSENQLLTDAASLSEDPAPPAAAPEKPVVEAAPKAQAEESTPTVQNAPAAQNVPAAKHENSYLKGIDLSGEMPTVVANPSDNVRTVSQAQSSSTNSLTSFSWDDSKPQEQAAPKPEQPQIKVDSKSNSLMSWLGVVKKAPPAPVQTAPAAAKPSNPYIMDLS
jgi:hypothetical protein